MSRETAVQRLSGVALNDLEGLVDRIVEQLVQLEPAGFYTEATVADLRAATRVGATSVLEVLAGRSPETDVLAVAEATGRRQVQQDLPLEGALRALRVAGQALWEQLVSLAGRADATDLLAGASEVWRLIDRFSSVAAEAYRREESSLRRRDSRVRSALLAALLDGRGADPQFARDAERGLGVPGPWTCVVALAEEPGALSVEHPADRLAACGLTSVWVTTGSGEVGLVQAATAAKVHRALGAGLRGRAGISPPITTLAELPTAQRLAEIAARSGRAGRLAELRDDLVGALVVDSPLVADVVWSGTVGTLLDAAGDDGPNLVGTAAAFLADAGSLNAAAARTHMHRNTMLYRLKKIEKLTGVSIRELPGQVQWVVGLRHHSLRRPASPD